jgi:hypothetical protein
MRLRTDSGTPVEFEEEFDDKDGTKLDNKIEI